MSQTYYPIMKILKFLPKIPIGRPFLGAIDGGSGSGKSTLATELKNSGPNITVVHMDDFYVPVSDEVLLNRKPAEDYESCFDWKRMIDQVLKPLRDGKTARFQSLDWGLGVLREWKEVAPNGMVFIEGVYSLRPEFRSYFDFSIWVETEAQLRRDRMIARNQNTKGQMDCWQRGEEWYQRFFSPDKTASLVIDGKTGAIK